MQRYASCIINLRWFLFIELREGPLRFGNAVGDGEDSVTAVVDRVLPAGK